MFVAPRLTLRKTREMSNMYTFGYSSCPNDTFMLDALVHRKGPLEDAPQIESWIQDIAALNDRAIGGPDPLDFTKLSVAALGHCKGQYRALDAGAALGRGVGPLVLFNPQRKPELQDKAGTQSGLAALDGLKVAIPGARTTAELLLSIFGPSQIQRVPMRFDQICQALIEGRVDAGVVIHETRFVYQGLGLSCLADLGELWEQDSGLPLPLGIMAARADLKPMVAKDMAERISASVKFAHAHPQESAGFVAEHAQDLDAKITGAHIDLYVNTHSESLGEEGRRSVAYLLERGHAVGRFPEMGSTLWAGE